MHRVAKVEAKPNFVLKLVFDDGRSGEISLATRLSGPVFEPLSDPSFFARASVDAFGAVY